MRECVSCYEQCEEESFVVPHCGISAHSACHKCTDMWYEQNNSNESCMVCRVGKPENNFLVTFVGIWFGCLVVVIAAYMLILHHWSLLVFDIYIYGAIIKFSPQTKLPRLFYAFCAGFMSTCLLISLCCLYDYNFATTVVYVMYHFSILCSNMYLIKLVCDLYTNQQYEVALTCLKLLVFVVSVGMFAVQIISQW